MKSEKIEEIVICDCSSLEHQFVFRGYSDEQEIYLNTHLHTHYGFFKRLWKGICYAFGYKSRFGEFDEVVITKEHLPKFKKIVEHLEEF